MDPLLELKRVVRTLTLKVDEQDRRLGLAETRIGALDEAVRAFGRVDVDATLKAHRLREAFAESLDPAIAELTKRVANIEKRRGTGSR